MDFLKDLAKSISESMRERLTNPFLGTLAIAWCAWNYKFLLVIIGNSTSAEKISFIENTIYPNWFSKPLYGLVAPIVSAGIFVWLYPIINRHISTYHKKQQLKTYEEILAIDSVTPITMEERDKLIARQKEKELIYKDQVNGLKLEVQDLELALREATKKNRSLRQPNSASDVSSDINSDVASEVTNFSNDADIFIESMGSRAIEQQLSSKWDSLNPEERTKHLCKITRNQTLKYPTYEVDSLGSFKNEGENTFSGMHTAILYQIKVTQTNSWQLATTLQLSIDQTTELLRKMIRDNLVIAGTTGKPTETLALSRSGEFVLDRLLSSYGVITGDRVSGN